MKQATIQLMNDETLEYEYRQYIRAFDRQLVLQRHGLEQRTIFNGIKLSLALLQEEMFRRKLIYKR